MTHNPIAALLAALPSNQQEAARVLVDRLIAEIELLHAQRDAALSGWRDAELAVARWEERYRQVKEENSNLFRIANELTEQFAAIKKICDRAVEELRVRDAKYRALLRVCVKQDREREAAEARLWRDEEPWGENRLPVDGLAALRREGRL